MVLFYVFEMDVLYWKGISDESDSFLQMYQRNVSRMAAGAERQDGRRYANDDCPLSFLKL